MYCIRQGMFALLLQLAEAFKATKPFRVSGPCFLCSSFFLQSFKFQPYLPTFSFQRRLCFLTYSPLPGTLGSFVHHTCPMPTSCSFFRFPGKGLCLWKTFSNVQHRLEVSLGLFHNTTLHLFFYNVIASLSAFSTRLNALSALAVSFTCDSKGLLWFLSHGR